MYREPLLQYAFLKNKLFILQIHKNKFDSLIFKQKLIVLSFIYDKRKLVIQKSDILFATKKKPKHRVPAF